MDFSTIPENSAKLLVDIRGLMYNSFFWAKKHYNVNIREDMESAMLHQIFAKLKLGMRTARTKKVIFCCDSATSIRKKLFPAYKGRRTKDEDFVKYKDFFLHIQNEIIPSMGFSNVLEAEGLEADDIIASISLSEDKMPVMILSDDADLYQCLKDNVYMMSIRGRDDVARIITPAKFEKLFGIPASRWADVKSLAGCGTDCIPGIAGVGETKAISYLLGEMNPKGITYNRIKNSQDVINLTSRLVRLPFDGQILEFDYEPDNFNIDYISRLINKYSLITLESPFWVEVFE
jgi:5'-3' exonuclease